MEWKATGLLDSAVTSRNSVLPTPGRHRDGQGPFRWPQTRSCFVARSLLTAELHKFGSCWLAAKSPEIIDLDHAAASINAGAPRCDSNQLGPKTVWC